MDEVIVTHSLTKRYKDVTAVAGISLSVKRGEIYGFLGLNGAGKTTTIRMLLGMIRQSEGKSYILGKETAPGNTDLWKNVGYMVEVPYSYPNLTVRENLEIVRRLRLINVKSSVDEIMEKLKLTQYANRKASHLSLGNAQRLGLAKALIHKPEVLLLDEPSNGLDPAGIIEVRELITNLAHHHGVTVFISSHILNEISRFATRIGIIHEGKLIREVNRMQLDELRNHRLVVNTLDNVRALEVLSKNSYEPLLQGEGSIILMEKSAIDAPEKISSLLAKNDIPLTHLNVVEEDLESFFLRTISANE